MLPDGFNWLDIVIGLILIGTLIKGISIGLIRSIFSIAGIIAGLVLAINFYAQGSSLLMSYISIAQLFADALSFFMIFSFAAVTVHVLGSIIAGITRFRIFRLVDKIGGSAAGLFIGLTMVGVILIMMTAFPLYENFQDHVEESYLAGPIVETTFSVYEELSVLLPIDLPGLTVVPEEVSSYFNNIGSSTSYSGVNYADLEGATCFVCEAPVEFIGYLDNDKQTVSPKFICTRCGRTSDGCQTYEGYHMMYETCPVELGLQGYRLDCGIWKNNSYHRPAGPCVVCGVE